MNYQSVLEFQKENFRLELDKKTIENIECSRNTMEKASKKRLPKLLKANQGFLVKNLKKNETSQNDWREEQSLLLISNLNGIGKSLKPETIRYNFLKNKK